jgi:hypothetical protein
MKATHILGSTILGILSMVACAAPVDGVEAVESSEESLVQTPSFVYEHSASRPLAAGEDMAAAVAATVALLKAEIEASQGVELALGTNGLDALPYPPIDYEMDGVPDAYGTIVEVTFPGDEAFLLDPARSMSTPWVIGVYAQFGQVHVDIAVPPTFARLFFQGSPKIKAYEAKARTRHTAMRTLIDGALSASGFATLLNEGIEGTEMPQSRISAIADSTGVTIDSAVRTVDVPGRSAAEVLSAIEQAFAQSQAGLTTPDLDNDGMVQEELPEGLMAYLQGGLTCDDMHGFMNGATPLWSMGGTLQPWRSLRTLDQSGPGKGSAYVLEVCQPFYAQMALSSGIHHLTAMPCNVAVWEKNGTTTVAIVDPNFIFSYFFIDADMPEPMMKLFGMFPTTVFNEMAAVANNGLTALEAEGRFELRPVPNTCH